MRTNNAENRYHVKKKNGDSLKKRIVKKCKLNQSHEKKPPTKNQVYIIKKLFDFY